MISSGRRSWLYITGSLLLVYLLLPTLIVIPMSFSDTRYLTFPPQGFSFRWFAAYFMSPEWREATFISLVAACLTTAIATSFGTACAYALRMSDLPFAKFVMGLTVLPLIIPGVLIGVGSFFLFVQLGIAKTLLGVVIAHVVLALPIVVITIGSGFSQYDVRQEMVARSLGASRSKAFFTITLPQIRASVLSAAVFAFVTSLDEAVVIQFIGGGSAPTLPRRMFSALRDEIDPTITAISTCLILVSLCLVVFSQRSAPTAKS